MKTATDNNQAGTSDDSVYACTFDSLSRCIVEEQSIGSVAGQVESAYDANSNLTSLTYPRKFGGGNRVISYTYDNLDRVSLVAEGATQLASYSFYGPARINKRQYRPAATNPMTTAYSYDAVKRVTTIEHSNLLQPNGTTPITMNFNYAFDREGSVIAEHATHEGTSGTKQIGLDFYHYDSAYRMTKEFRSVPGTLPTNNIATNPTFTGTASDDRTWSLDGITNWKSYIDSLNGVPTTTTRSVNSVNEYGSVTVGGGTPVVRTHDNNGNLTDDGTNLYEYDALNRLVKTTRKSDSTVIGVHAWDAQSRRVLHTVTDGTNNVDLRFFFKHGALIEETDASGNLLKQHVFGGMGERAETLSNTTTLYLFGMLDGSIVSYANSKKIVQSYFDYKAQGLARLVGPNIDNLYFTSDDSYSNLSINNANDYLWQGVRIDFETGHFYEESTSETYDSFAGRKITRSINFWFDSLELGNGYQSDAMFQKQSAKGQESTTPVQDEGWRPKKPNKPNVGKVKCGVESLSLTLIPAGKNLAKQFLTDPNLNVTILAKFKVGNGFSASCCEVDFRLKAAVETKNNIPMGNKGVLRGNGVAMPMKYAFLGRKWDQDGRKSPLDPNFSYEDEYPRGKFGGAGLFGRNSKIKITYEMQLRVQNVRTYNRNCEANSDVAIINPKNVVITGKSAAVPGRGGRFTAQNGGLNYRWRKGKVTSRAAN